MQITFTLKTADLAQRFKHPTTNRDRWLRLLAYTWPLIFVFINYSGRSVSVRVLEGIAILCGIIAALLAAGWGLQLYLKHTNQPRTYSVEISETDLFYQVLGEPAHRYPWLQVREVADWGDYFVFTSTAGKHLVLIPTSAFDDADQARAFFRQSCFYWEAAKNVALWPPAPRSGA